MSTNKALFTGFYDAMNSRDADVIAKAIDELVAPDVVFHTPIPMPEKGREALRWVWSELLRGFPDIHVEVEDMIAEGDRVATRNTVTGTHHGEFRGIPATGNSIHYNEIFIMRFAGGRIAELWGVVDVHTQLRQLGQLAA